MSVSSNAITLDAGSYLVWYSLDYKSQYASAYYFEHRMLTTSGTFPAAVPDFQGNPSATSYQTYNALNARFVTIPTGGATFKFQFRDYSGSGTHYQYVKNVSFVAQKI
jgi:hypothetical protein